MSNIISVSEGKIALYAIGDNNVYVDVVFKDETFWMTQKAVAELFDADRSVMMKKNSTARQRVQKLHLFKKRAKFANLTQDFFRHARRQVPLILEVSTGSANTVWRKKDKSDVKVISAQ